MKKNYFLMLLVSMLFVAFTGNSQELMLNGDLELWDDANNPTSWDIAENISQESVEINGGMYSAAQMSEPDRQDLRQVVEGIVGGQQYVITYYYKDNDPAARTRIWSYWLTGESTIADNEAELRPSTYSEDNPDWQEFTVTLVAPAAADGFRFEMRTYKQDDMSGGYVYFDDFSVTGTTTNDPEPTNYPTDFAASVTGLNLSLSWTDAIGEQLPGAYLVYGIKGADGDFPVPTDGMPVVDDLDWSDGMVAVNVGYGMESYNFPGVEGDDIYRFVIYPYTNVSANTNYKTDGDAPTTSVNVSGITVINSEDFESGTLGTWWEYSVAGDQVWEPYEFSGDRFARVSGYSGGPQVNEDWLISPAMDLSPFTDVKFNFTSAMNYDGEALQLFFSQDYDGSSDPNAGFTWLELTEFAAWSEGSWDWVESGDIDLSLYANPNCYLAFKYVSNTDAASTWEIDDILVSSESGVGLFENEVAEIKVYPNPATNQLYFNAEADGDLSILSITGQVVYQNKINGGQQSINVQELPEGMYLIRFIGDDATIQSGKFLKK